LPQPLPTPPLITIKSFPNRFPDTGSGPPPGSDPPKADGLVLEQAGLEPLAHGVGPAELGPEGPVLVLPARPEALQRPAPHADGEGRRYPRNPGPVPP